MVDKSSFTPDEWKLLLESVMASSIAITAADPSGLWGLLKESFAGGTELAKAKMDPKADALIKAVVEDFGTAEGRSVTRDGLSGKLKGSKPPEIKEKCVDILRQAAAVVDAKAPGDAAKERRERDGDNAYVEYIAGDNNRDGDDPGGLVGNFRDVIQYGGEHGG